MESLTLHGVRTVLFTRLPTADEFGPFADFEAVGLAGTSRSQTPRWMEEHLPLIFHWLKSLGARMCHYKVCSTFDSSPEIGNIGKAIEIGREVFQQETVPLVVGAPQLGRYTAFGHLFASYQGQTYRIDRHPVMSHHPMTPMTESDLRLHLARQTGLPVALVPVSQLSASPNAVEVDQELQHHSGIVLFDVIDAPTQRQAGRQLLRRVPDFGPFIAGSSGVEYALMAALAETEGMRRRDLATHLPAVGRVLVASGSCSPTTARQIRHAMAHGFEGIEADPMKLVTVPAYSQHIADEALLRLDAGASTIIYTALDGAGQAEALDTIPGSRHRVGELLGQIVRMAISSCGLSRAILAGGDTSSHALSQLNVYALTTRFPLRATPGSPLCIAHSSDPLFHGLEVAMKGGQVGGDDYFVMLRDGIPTSP
jgi:uncharacterized protein YgbK (DUF1537 family)